MTVTDRLTGRIALVFEAGKSMYRDVTKCTDWVLDLVPGADYLMSTADWTNWHGKDGSLSSGDAGEEEISAYVGFPLEALPSQECSDEVEKKYTIANVPSYHSSLAQFTFNVPKPKTVASFLRSLLNDDGRNEIGSEKQDAAALSASTAKPITARSSAVYMVLQTEHLLISIFDSLL